MMNIKSISAIVAIFLGVFASLPGHAQSTFSEDFTGTSTTNSWYFFRGACLTASTGPIGTSPGQLPGCLAVKTPYYNNETLVGGQNGVAGGTTQTLPDPANFGALRFTNGAPNGFGEGGAIISQAPFNTANGLQITFKSVTYRGNSGNIGGTGGVSDGADGISFFLMDGSVTPSAIGSQGGSLSYTCSNPGNIPGHSIIDGLVGGYIGLGIDEFGNFLNANDNTASGFGAQGNRIGLRGAGNVAWPYLNAHWPTQYPSTLTAAQQQSAVAATCQSGYLWDYSTPAVPVPYLTGGSTTSGTFSGTVTRGSFNITGIPTGGIPAALIVGATITDPRGFLPANTTVTAIGTNTVTLTSTPGNSAGRSGTNETFTYTSSQPGQNSFIADYPAIPGGYTILSGVNIANEGALARGAATPIFYNLKITPSGSGSQLLSLSYSLSGAAFQPVITNQDITASNGPIPSSLLFGFAGSTGGATNIHEIMCFKAAPNVTSGSSSTVNQKESAKVESTTQAFFAFYDPNTWTGTVTANTLIDTAGVVTVSSTANWDAGCVLTGTTTGCATTGATAVTAATPAPASRVMLSWDSTNNVGVPFTFTSGISTAEVNTLDALDATQTSARLNFLRGVRTNEVNAAGVGLYRSRTSVLGDIVDSSPTYVGQPTSPYASTWSDRLPAGSTDTMVENTGQSYTAFTTAQLCRLNVVYVGSNDGFLHGFRAGSLDSNGNLVATTAACATAPATPTATPNDGQEVLAYMPGSVMTSALKQTPGATAASCTDHSHTQSVVQNIHGVTPAIGTTSPLCVDASLDLSNVQYGHNFFVDATPGTGDLFYGGNWHTWVVGGLGAGGAAIYALDVTNPANFTQGNAGTVVVGEWNAATITCSSACGGNLGNTFGVPQIRRLHNGKWGVIFGNGFGSTSGGAGIYVMTVDVNASSVPVTTFYYLSAQAGTGTATSPCTSNCNGIAYVTPADLDGDHITDYVYAGDLQGNVWRFDLTAADPTTWAVSSTAPLFTTPAGQPITSQLLVLSSSSNGSPRLMVEFATGQRTQITNTVAASYASGAQAIYGIWDWNFSAWNAISSTPWMSLPATTAATGLSTPFTIPSASSGSPLSITRLTQQTFTATASGVIEGTNVAVCWQGSTSCATNNKFGFYASLIGGSATTPGGSEQVIFNPVFFQGAMLVDSVVPASNIPTSCSSNLDTGFTYAINVANGGVFNNVFPNFTKNGVLISDTTAAAVETNATGSVYVVGTSQGLTNIVYQTVTGSPAAQVLNVPANIKAKRLTWIERR
jgi:type IV pilus assembly protein PilY1